MTGYAADHATSVAVIGMAGRFPGAANVAALWDNLCQGVESVTFFSREQLDAAGVPPELSTRPDYVPARAVLDDVDQFDAGLFGYSARDADILDPQQRLFLECAWEAVEHAGYDPEQYDGHVGVYAGSSLSGYLLNLLTNPDLVRTVGHYRMLLANDKDHLTMQTAFKLNLHGPAVTVQSACSTSLTAVHVACQALLTHQCDMALAGGVTVRLPQIAGYLHEAEGIMSPDGHCRAFDEAARGTVAGSGAGVVVLRRLSDAVRDGDTVHAVVLGSAVNNDGATKAGYTAPSSDGQAEVIAEAIEVAGVDPATISYIEAHGTGTQLGDPIEISALSKALPPLPGGASRAIGSVKTNLGHLDAAAGVAGLIKTVLALRHGLLPPSLHFTSPNPQARLAESGLQVNTRLTPWQPPDGQPRRAGVSSFGMGGTNAHVVLEEPPAMPQPADPVHGRQVLPLSAANPTALRQLTENLARHLAADATVDLADVGYTLQVGRRALRYRRAVVADTVADAIAALRGHGPSASLVEDPDRDAGRQVAFMFPGQGSQRSGMAAALYRQQPRFRQLVDRCATRVSPALGFDLREALFPAAGSSRTSPLGLRDTAVAQPALFTIEYALARLWMAWGVRPDAMIGHSVGEYVAACLAGVLPLEDALDLVVARGRLVQRLPTGAMLSVPLSERELREVAGERLALAAMNAPALGVLAGCESAIAGCEAELAAKGVPTRRLYTSHAFHSAQVEPVLDEFRDLVAGVALRAPSIPYLSNVTGAWITAAQATSPGYWADHLRATVQFGEGVRTLLSGPSQVLVEVGPGQTLGVLARQHGTAARPVVVASLPSHTRDALEGAEIPSALARLWVAGVQVDWAAYHSGAAGDHGGGPVRRRVPLPTYPFQRSRHWIDAPNPAMAAGTAWSAATSISPGVADTAGSQRPDPLPGAVLTGRDGAMAPETPAEPLSEIEQVVAEMWREMLGATRLGRDDSFIDLGGHSLVATQITARLRETFEVDLTIQRFFELGTVARVAAAIEELLIDELEKLSDEEVARLSTDPGLR